VIDRGKGIYVYDSQGKRYIEGLSGLWCSALGYGNEEIIEAASEQMRRLSFSHVFGSKSHDLAIELSEKLKELSPCPASKVLFSSGGSEANDAQVKLTWYYNNARGRPQKKKIISRLRGYHGVTIGAASLTGLPAVQSDFDLPINNILFTSCPHYYRYAEPGESEEEFTDRMARDLDELIQKEGPETIAAFIAEPIMGAGGAIVPPESYFPKINRVLSNYDVRIISDEVICGFGRTGNWWGAQSLGLQPTSISVAKALTSAYFPLGAITIEEDVYEAMLLESEKIGIFGHGHTYAAHPVGCAVALKAIEIYERDKIIDHVRKVAKTFEARFRKLSDHPLVGNVRSNGLVGAVELVADKATKRPFDTARLVGPTTARLLEENGIITRAMGDAVALCPPLIITDDEINEAFDLFEKTLDEAEAWVRTENLRVA
jgi:4-aminobutyrate--pyruvate transaminase